jgi:hypothetical protein
VWLSPILILSGVVLHAGTVWAWGARADDCDLTLEQRWMVVVMRAAA